MKSLLATVALLALAGIAHAQTACPKVADNKAHVCWTAPTLYTDGTAIAAGTAITYTVQRQTGATWANDATTAALDWTSPALAPGSYVYRITATIDGATSDPSNNASKAATKQTPNAPVIVIAVTIAPDGKATVRRVYTFTPRAGEFVALVASLP